MYHFKKNLNT